MWSLRGKDHKCREFLERLEAVPVDAHSREELYLAMTEEDRAHGEACGACSQAVDEVLETRAVLLPITVQTGGPSPWFAARVMARIESEEAELVRGANPWAAVPRLASRLSWATAAVLLAASAWLYQRPVDKAPTQRTDGTAESLFETAQTPMTQDEVLYSLGERQK